MSQQEFTEIAEALATLLRTASVQLAVEWRDGCLSYRVETNNDVTECTIAGHPIRC